MNLAKFAARRRGFTLIELLIVIVVIAILALIVIPRVTQATERARVSSLKANLHMLRTAIASFEADTGHFPTTADLVELSVGKVGGTGADITGWHGPYVSDQGNVIAGSGGVPANPFADTADTTVASQWTYTPADGKIISKKTGTHGGETIPIEQL